MARRLATGDSAPDFELADTAGSIVKLAEFTGRQQVLLVLLRGLF